MTPLKQAILDHGHWKDPIVIIPIVISRTGSFHVKTLAKIAQLISLDEEPPEGLTYRDLTPAARRLTMALHTHAQQWMTLLLNSRNKPWHHTLRPHTDADAQGSHHLAQHSRSPLPFFFRVRSGLGLEGGGGD